MGAFDGGDDQPRREWPKHEGGKPLPLPVPGNDWQPVDPSEVGPSITEDLGANEAILRKTITTYTQSREAEDCRTQVLSVSNIYRKEKENDFSDPELAAMKSYDRDCFKKIDTLPTSIREEVLTVVGFLYDGVYFCSGTLVDRRHILTARHCLYDSLGIVRPAGKLVFFSARDPNTPIRISSFSPPQTAWKRETGSPLYFNADWQTEDYVFLETAQELHGTISFPSLPDHAPPDMHDKLFIVAPSSWAMYVRRNENTRRGLPNPFTHLDGSWTDFLRFDNAETCRVISKSGVCLFHGCQTSGLASGAGIFRTGRNEKLELIGVHDGGVFKPEAATELSCPSLPQLRVNYGRAITRDLY